LQLTQFFLFIPSHQPPTITIQTALFTLSAVSAQPVPLPNSYPGFRWGNINAPVLIEGFLDLLCPDCSGTWPTVKEVLNHYGPTNVSYIFHVFPLPYHTWAFHAAQGAQVVRSLNASDAGFFAYADLIFNNQGNFYSTTMTAEQIIDAYATLVSANLPYSKSDFTAGMNDPNLNELARIHWKFGTSRYTTGTPHFLCNGLPVDDQVPGDGTTAPWYQMIDPLLGN